MRDIFPAQERYNYGMMGSLGSATYMLIAQKAFPESYDETKDKYWTADSDRILMWDYDHFCKIDEKYRKADGIWMGEELFFTSSDEKTIMEYLSEMATVGNESNEKVKWTGFRVLGTVNRSNGFPIWSLSLFCKGKGSETKVHNYPPNLQIQNKRFIGILGHEHDLK